MTRTNVDRAEHASRARALLMALGAAALLGSAFLGYGDAANSNPSLRGGLWLVQIALFMLLLLTGGGLMMNRRMRTLMNDELSLQNRARALETGFVTALLAALACYVASWTVEIGLRDGVRLITATAVALALLHYAWLEWRDS